MPTERRTSRCSTPTWPSASPLRTKSAKGFVADGKVAGEGSTNWSVSGEGQAVNGPFSVKAKGYKAQNNTQSIITDPDTISRFSAQLVSEHMIAQRQAATANTASAVEAAKK